jgi:hypothetical protein
MSGTVVFQSQTLATPGAGIVVGQDDVSGTAYQYVKMDVGVTGASKPVSYASGTGLPVKQVYAQVGENFFGTLFTAGVTNGTLVPAPASGTYTRVFDVMVSGSAAGTAMLELGDGTAFLPGVFGASGGFVFNSARGVRTHGTSHDILFTAASGSWGVSVNYTLET